MSAKHLLRSFAGGEITPELAGRLDLVKYQTGLSLCRNFITLPHGPAARRPGFGFVRAAGDSTHPVRVIPFTFSASQTAVIELGHEYVRFHIDGATLMSGGVPYEIASPYQGDDLFDLHYAQSADVITLAHPDYATRQLARLSATNWSLTEVSFAPTGDIPTNVVATPTVATVGNPTATKYVVTAVQADGVTESLASTYSTAVNDLSLAGNFNTVTWSPANGASRYNVYKLRGGVYGYIGQVPAATGGAPLTIASATTYGDGEGWFGTQRVRITTTTPHGYTTGDRVLVEDTVYFDGVWSITVDDADTFNFACRSTLFNSASSGTTSIPTLSLVDDNVLPDTSQSPPEDIIALNEGPGDYPGATVYHEQRRWFAGTNSKPQVMWATRTGTETNLTSSVPAREADGMELRVAASQYNQIRHLVALSDLIAFTAGGEFRVYSDSAPAITPTSVTIKPQGYAGASNVQPVVTTASILYVQAQGSRIRELSYSWEANAYRTVDAAIMAPHRFNGFTVVDLAYSRAPDSILWAVRNDGALLGLTYVPDQQVFGWHAHDTDGTFESVCVVAEGNEDVLYAVVRRTIGGTALRYIERLRTRVFTAQEDAFFVDSGLTYSGAPATTFSGLAHLEGKEVDILADGAVHPRKTVTGGAVTLDYAASVVHIGLPFVSDLRTLPLAMEGTQAAGQGTVKNVSKVYLRVAQSSLVKAGPDFTRLREYPARAVSDPYGSPPALRDGELSLSIDPTWSQDGAVCVRQDAPLPLTVLSMTLETQSGG